MPDIKIINPDTLGKPLGQYSQITRVKASEFVYSGISFEPWLITHRLPVVTS